MQKTDAMVDQNLDAHNRPNNSAPFNNSLQIQVIFKQKKTKLKATVDQNLDAQNRPDNPAPFNESLWIQVTT